jgi:hypothetical protein
MSRKEKELPSHLKSAKLKLQQELVKDFSVILNIDLPQKNQLGYSSFKDLVRAKITRL